ncbi:MAG: hypothetical protein ACREBR_02650 [bacterium]
MNGFINSHLQQIGARENEVTISRPDCLVFCPLAHLSNAYNWRNCPHNNNFEVFTSSRRHREIGKQVVEKTSMTI